MGEVQALFAEFKMMQVQVEKTNLLNLFYEIEFRDDDEEGLNRKEYDMFMARLDEQTAAKFKSFNEMDINGDNNIDMNEFQSELDRIYNRVSAISKLKSKRKDKKKGKGKNNAEK